MNVGIVGCGVISRNYAEHAGAFDSFELVACADLVREQAAELGEAHGLAVLAIDELLGGPVDPGRAQPDAVGSSRRRHPGGARGRQARLHREAAGERRAGGP